MDWEISSKDLCGAIWGGFVTGGGVCGEWRRKWVAVNGLKEKGKGLGYGRGSVFDWVVPYSPLLEKRRGLGVLRASCSNLLGTDRVEIEIESIRSRRREQ